MSYNSDSEQEENSLISPEPGMELIEQGRRRAKSIIAEVRSANKKELAARRELFKSDSFIRSGENSRDLDVAAEFVEIREIPLPPAGRGEKRRASFDNKFLPSKVNKTDDMHHVPTISKVNAAMTKAT